MFEEEEGQVLAQSSVKAGSVDHLSSALMGDDAPDVFLICTFRTLDMMRTAPSPVRMVRSSACWGTLCQDVLP